MYVRSHASLHLLTQQRNTQSIAFNHFWPQSDVTEIQQGSDNFQGQSLLACDTLCEKCNPLGNDQLCLVLNREIQLSFSWCTFLCFHSHISSVQHQILKFAYIMKAITNEYKVLQSRSKTSQLPSSPQKFHIRIELACFTLCICQEDCCVHNRVFLKLTVDTKK